MAKRVDDPQVRGLLATSGTFELNGIEDSYVQTVRAADGYTGVNNSAPISFSVENTTNDALDLSRSYIVTNIAVQMTTSGGVTANVAEDATVCLAQNAGQRMFSRMSVYLNDVSIGDEILTADNLLHWHGWLDQLTEKSAPYGQNIALRTVAIYDDSGAEQASANNAVAGAALDGTNTWNNEWEIEQSESALRGVALARVTRNQPGNLGENDFVTRLSPSAASRQRAILGGATVPLVFIPPAAIFKAGKYLPPGCRLRIELTKAPNNAIVFYKYQAAAGAGALSYGSASVNFIQSRLMLRRVRPSPDLLERFRSNMLAGQRFDIPLWAARGVRYNVPVGTSTFQRTGVLAGPGAEVVYIAISRDALGLTPMVSPYATGGGNEVYSSAAYVAAVPNVSAAAYPLAVSGTPAPIVSELFIRVAGKRFPEDGFRFENASESDLFEAYSYYLEAAGASVHGGKEPVLSWYAFKKNYTIYPISLRDNGTFHFTGELTRATENAAKSGGIEVYVKFAAASVVAVDVLVLSKHTAFISLNPISGAVTKIGI